MNKKYILFDLDGTITDPMVGITKALQYALRKFGINIEDNVELAKYIGPPLKSTFIDGFGLELERAEKAIEYYREYFSTKGIYENYLYKDMEELLIKLKGNGKILMVATSKPRVFAEIILEHFNIKKYFDFVSGSELDGTRNEKDEVIKYALSENKITEISEVIMVGDRKHDILGAKKLGIESIGVLYGYGSYEEISQCGADYIVRDIKELSLLLNT